MPYTNTIDTSLLSGNLREAKNSSGGSAGGAAADMAISMADKIPGMGGAADVAGKLREGKMLDAAADAAVKGAATYIAPFLGNKALKGLEFIGIDSKMIIGSVAALVLFLFLIVLSGGYAYANKWGMLWSYFKSKAANTLDSGYSDPIDPSLYF